MTVTDEFWQRQAWLTFPADTGRRLYLDDLSSGYFCEELDIAYPEVRDVTSNRPDQHGIDDRTALFGSRVVSAKIVAVPGGAMTVDQIAQLFSRYLDPASRPELHIQTSATAERVLVMRPSQFAAPFTNKARRDIQLQWIAADPIMYAAAMRSGTSIPGTNQPLGRAYPLAFDRRYPPGYGQTTVVTMVTVGDLPVWPIITVYGPVTAPFLRFNAWEYAAGPMRTWSITFQLSFQLSAGEYVVIDTRAHSAFFMGDPTRPVINQLNQSQTYWIPIPPALPGAQYPRAQFRMEGTNITPGVTNAYIEWRDAFLQ